MDDDGIQIEPDWYCPIIPMILVNGSEGIGTGFSTKIPCYNPLDIIDNLQRLIDGKEMKEPDYTDKCTDAMTLAFDKRRADDRKGWLMDYDRENIISYEERDVSFKDFVHRELIH
jgi:hypothetical protein